YFEGRWVEPFGSSLTRERRFTTANGKRIATPTMERTTNLAYRRASRFQAVRLPYTAGLTALYIVLPDSGASAVTVLDDVERTGWPITNPRAEARTVQIPLPRLPLTPAPELRTAF